MSYIEMQNICKSYKTSQGELSVLENVSLSIDKGEFVAVMGRSGSGKTTLLNIISGLQSINSGKFFVEGVDYGRATGKKLLEYRRRYIGLIVQNYALLEDETAFDNVALPLKIRKADKQSICKKVDEILERFEILDKRNEPVMYLSGGQKQRVAVARAMVYNPGILLADEPTSSLDKESEYEIMKWLTEINKQGTTVILVTHENEIADKCKRKLEVKNKQVNKISNLISQLSL